MLETSKRMVLLGIVAIAMFSIFFPSGFAYSQEAPQGRIPIAIITLKNGQTVSGKVLSSDEEKLSVETERKTFTIYYSEIESMEIEYREEKPERPVIGVKAEHKNPLISGFSSLLLPGLGQFYNRERQKGLIFLAGEIIRNTLYFSVQSQQMKSNLLFFGVILRIASCFEAAKTARETNQRPSNTIRNRK